MSHFVFATAIAELVTTPFEYATDTMGEALNAQAFFAALGIVGVMATLAVARRAPFPLEVRHEARSH